MELNLQPLAASCCVTGRPFAEGDRILSFLIQPTTVEVVRYDLLAEHGEGFAPEGAVVCRWSHVFKPRVREGDSERALKLTAENLFLALADPATEPTPENTRLVQFLALMLERKRLIKRRGPAPGGDRELVEHSRTKQIFEIPSGELTPEFFVAVQRQLSVLVGEPKPEPEKAPEPPPSA